MGDVAALRRKGRDRFGDSMIALCGGALALNLLLVAGLLFLIAAMGLPYFWQRHLVLLKLDDGASYLGEIHNEEAIPAHGGGASSGDRVRMKLGNRDLTGEDFKWIDEARVVERSEPADAVILERLEYGNFYGTMVELRKGEKVLARGPEETWREFFPLHEAQVEQLRKVRGLERGEIGTVNRRIEKLRLALRRLEIEDLPPAERDRRKAVIDKDLEARQAEYETLSTKLAELRERLLDDVLVMEAASGVRKEIPVAQVVRAIRPNGMSLPGRAGLYLSRIWEFVSGDPRESNTEGGIFPAIFGTVLMVFLMSFVVVPLGVLAALYLREYATQGPLVALVRIAVNNLAGVPSIVFGVFGLGFFVYMVGGTIDRIFYPEALPTSTFGTGGILWASLTLALLTVPVVIVATEEGLAAVPRVVREGSLALGATKFETIVKVVIPAAAPGILTGTILAMARAAGEVAPLMIVGMVKLAPALPIDGTFPFIHLERKFMHLGFHIFDVGFQSPNVEATKPLVFATSLLLIAVVTVMNLMAIMLRNHLRRKYTSSAF